MAHLVSAVGSGSLLALEPALLGNTLLVEHVAGLLHKLANGGIVLAVLGVGIVGGGGVAAVGSAVGTVAGSAADA